MVTSKSNVGGCEVIVTATGDGNNSETTITITDQQAAYTKFEEVPHGVKITIVGEWERMALVDAIAKLAEKIVSREEQCVPPLRPCSM